MTVRFFNFEINIRNVKNKLIPEHKKTLRDHLEKVVLPYVPLALIVIFALFIGIYTWTESLDSDQAAIKDHYLWLRITSVNGFLEFCKSNLANLSAAIVAAYVSFKIYDGYLMKGAREEDQNNFADSIADRVNLKITRGILCTHNGLDSETVADSIARTERTVIIETWIGWETLDKLRPGFIKAFNNGYSITIFLLHPNSPNVSRRQLDMAPNDKFSGRDEVIRSLQKLASIREEWIEAQEDPIKAESQIKIQLEVICYDALPALQIYKLQDRVIVGFFLNDRISNNGIQFEISLEGQMGKDILRHIAQYKNKKKKRHIISVDLEKSIEGQFDSKHLDPQLADAAKQVINLNSGEIAPFSDILVKLLTEEKRMGQIEKRKDNLVRLLEEIKSKINESSAA